MSRFPDSQVVWDPSVLEYRFSQSHPMDPVRLRLTMELARMLGVLDGADVVAPGGFDPAELGRAHTDDYQAAVRVAGSGRSRIDLTGFGARQRRTIRCSSTCTRPRRPSWGPR